MLVVVSDVVSMGGVLDGIRGHKFVHTVLVDKLW